MWSWIKNHSLVVSILVILVIWFLLTPGGRQYVPTSSELRAKEFLENESNKLHPMPGATYEPIISHGKDHSRWWVWIFFTTDLDFPAVRSHYDKVFQDNGWYIASSDMEAVKYNKSFNGTDYRASIEKYPDAPHKYMIVFRWTGGLMDTLQINYFLGR